MHFNRCKQYSRLTIALFCVPINNPRVNVEVFVVTVRVLCLNNVIGDILYRWAGQ